MLLVVIPVMLADQPSSLCLCFPDFSCIGSRQLSEGCFWHVYIQTIIEVRAVWILVSGHLRCVER